MRRRRPITTAKEMDQRLAEFFATIPALDASVVAELAEAVKQARALLNVNYEDLEILATEEEKAALKAAEAIRSRAYKAEDAAKAAVKHPAYADRMAQYPELATAAAIRRQEDDLDARQDAWGKLRNALNDLGASDILGTRDGPGYWMALSHESRTLMLDLGRRYDPGKLSELRGFTQTRWDHLTREGSKAKAVMNANYNEWSAQQRAAGEAARKAIEDDPENKRVLEAGDTARRAIETRQRQRVRAMRTWVANLLKKLSEEGIPGLPEREAGESEE